MKPPPGNDKSPSVDELINVVNDLSVESPQDSLQDDYRSVNPNPNSSQKAYEMLHRAMKKSTVQRAEDSKEVKLLHQRLYVHLNNKLSPEMPEYQNFLAILRAYLEKGEISQCRGVLDLLDKLETKEIISVGNYEELIRILRTAELMDLITTVRNSSKAIREAISAWNSAVAKETSLKSENKIITIQPITGVAVNITIDGKMTVHNLMLEYQERGGCQPKHQILVYQGKVMSADKNIADYSLKDGDKILNCQRLPGG